MSFSGTCQSRILETGLIFMKMPDPDQLNQDPVKMIVDLHSSTTISGKAQALHKC
jgi:hypothetical protein